MLGTIGTVEVVEAAVDKTEGIDWEGKLFVFVEGNERLVG